MTTPSQMKKNLFKIVQCLCFTFLLLACADTVWAQASQAENESFLGLWSSEVPFPLKSEAPFPANAEHFIVQDGNLEPEYKFMHETAIGFCGDELIFGWYNNVEKELQGKTIQRARRSFDFGATWTEPEIVMDRNSDSGTMYVGLQFMTVDNTLYLLTNLESHAERPVHCLLAKYDPEKKSWIELSPIAERFLSMQAPILNAQGNYIVSGSYAAKPGQTFASTPAVYVSQGQDIERPWRLVRLDMNEKVNVFAETGVVVDGSNVLAVTRREDSPFPNFYESRDWGETWRSAPNHEFPAVHSKFAAGKFSDGIRYIVFNMPSFTRLADGTVDVTSIEANSRDSLAIAIARPDENAFSHVYMISDPTTTSRLATSFYPCVVEHDGWVYVSYTAVFKDKPLRVGALTKFPLTSIEK